MKKNIKAFTLTELMISVIIIGIIAAFGIPGYNKVIRKGYERNAILNLKSLHGANEIYNARNREYLPGAGLNLAAINTGLSINIIDTDMTYAYTRTAPATYSATAAWTDFTVRIDQNPISAANPSCSVGPCPSL